MELKVKEVKFEEEKSTQEIEAKLLDEHAKKQEAQEVTEEPVVALPMNRVL